MWKAHALITKTLSTINRKAGNEIVLIYTGNIRGQFLPVNINGISMGGLARQAAVINQVKKEYQSSLIIDIGNNITRQTPLIKAQFSNKYFELVNYDAVCMGKGEIEFGLLEYCEDVNKSSLQLVCQNCPQKLCNDIIDSKIITAGKYKINILNVIPSHDLKGENKDSIVEATAMEIVRYTQSPRSQICDLRILVINDTWDNVQNYSKMTPLIDLIICSSLKQPIETPMKINSIPVFSNGEKGKYVGVIDLNFNEKKKFQSYESKLIPLTKEITPDPDIEYLTNQISLKSNIGEYEIPQNLSGGNWVDGVFTFISDRRGNHHAYLKIMKTKLEYPLSNGNTTCFQPSISFKNGSIIYLAKHDTLQRTALMTMDITGENTKEILCGGSVIQARFIPDESWIYITLVNEGNNLSDIYRIQPRGGELYPVVTWNDGSEGDMSFSHDGNFMVFISTRDGSRQIYISNIYGLTPIRLTNDDVDHEKPMFSPNDKSISYLSEKNNIYNHKDLWIYERETGKKIRLTEDAGVHDYCWLDDGATLLYSSGINLVDFNIINIKTGENKKFILSNKSKKYSETNPKMITYKNIKRIVYVREYETGEKKIFMVDLDGTKDRQVIFDNGNCWF
jgi:WD40 repeat protein